MSESDQMNRIAAEWVEFRNVIAQALREIVGGSDNQDHNAAAIIARLSHAGFTFEKVDELAASTNHVGSLDPNGFPSGRGGGGSAHPSH